MQNKSHEGIPTSWDTARSLVLAFLKRCEPHMTKLRDRQLIQSEIDRLGYGSGRLQSVIKPTGVVRKVDGLGRLVIPKELRRTLGMGAGDPLEIYTDEDAGVVYLQSYNMSRCAVCDSQEDVSPFKQKFLCERCISDLFEQSVEKIGEAAL